MMIGYSVAWIFLLITLCECQLLDDLYVLNFDSPVYVCSDEVSQEFLDTSNLEVERHNETVSFMKGPYTFLKRQESCLEMELIIEKETNGRAEVLVTHEICDLCDEIGKGLESDYYKFFKYFDFVDACPFEGKYEIINFVADTDDFPVNSANAGRYQLTLNFFGNCDCKNKEEFLGCVKLDFVIEPL